MTPAIEQFIRTHIQSVEQLEVLLLLHAERNREWTAHAVFQRIQSNEKSIKQRLESFAEQGLAIANGEHYRYASSKSEVDQTVAELAAAYRTRRVAVIETIFTPGPSAAESFADAFKLRKD